MKHLQLILMLVFVLVACGRNGDSKMEFSKSAPAPTEQVANDKSVNDAPENPEGYVIKTANYKFQVENVEGSTKNIEKLVSNQQAFIADLNLETASRTITNSLIIRVPSKNFESLMEALATEAIFIDYKRISAQDVTEEFVDIQSRLKTKKEVRDRYEEILKSKAKTVEDVLKAEEQIRILQEEIEAKEGRLKFLQSRVSMSTINLEIYQKVDYKEMPDTYEKPYITKVKQGLSNGWEIVTMLTLFLINIWPIIIVGILIYWRRNWIKGKLTKR